MRRVFFFPEINVSRRGKTGSCIVFFIEKERFTHVFSFVLGSVDTITLRCHNLAVTNKTYFVIQRT